MKRITLIDIICGAVFVGLTIVHELTGSSEVFFISCIELLVMTVMLIANIKRDEYWETKPIMSVFGVYCKLSAYCAAVFLLGRWPADRYIGYLASAALMIYIFISLCFKRTKPAFVMFIYWFIMQGYLWW